MNVFEFVYNLQHNCARRNRRSLSWARVLCLCMCIFLKKIGEGGSSLKFGKILRYTFKARKCVLWHWPMKAIGNSGVPGLSRITLRTERTEGETVSCLTWHAETKNGNKYLFFIYMLSSTKETQQGESNDLPSMKNKGALWVFHTIERM